MAMNSSPRIDSMDYRIELLSPDANAETVVMPSWKLNFEDMQFPDNGMDHSCGFRRLISDRRKRGQVKKYYKRQESLLKGFNEMDLVTGLRSGDEALREEEMRQLAKSERMAIRISNAANLVLFVAKVFASAESRSLAVIASTLDSFLDLLSGFVLWFTANAMRKPNQYHYPIGKNRMQPVGIIVFASVMATLGLQVLFVSAQELIEQDYKKFDPKKERWMIGIMVFVTVVKLLLFVYCRRFKNEIVGAYAQDHFFDVITNSTGLVAAVLAARIKWWIDPVGAIIIALYTISTWTRTVIENVLSLIGKTASPEYLSTLTYLVWNHHEEVTCKSCKHITLVKLCKRNSNNYQRSNEPLFILTSRPLTNPNTNLRCERDYRTEENLAEIQMFLEELGDYLTIPEDQYHQS